MQKLKKFTPVLVWFLLAALLYYGTFSIRESSSISLAVMPSSMYPRLIIGLFAVASLYETWRLSRTTATEDDAPYSVGSLLLCVAILFACIYFLKPIGGVICGSVFLGACFLLLTDTKGKPVKKILYVVLAVGLAAAFSYLFRYGFGIRLPLYPS